MKQGREQWQVRKMPDYGTDGQDSIPGRRNDFCLSEMHTCFWGNSVSWQTSTDTRMFFRGG
jgi:hypothetical protein